MLNTAGYRFSLIRFAGTMGIDRAGAALVIALTWALAVSCTEPAANSRDQKANQRQAAELGQDQDPHTSKPSASKQDAAASTGAFLTICKAKDEDSPDYHTVKVLSLYQETCQMTYDRLKRAKKLKLYNKKITSLAALADFDHLEKLFINRNQIADLSPIAGFKHLKTLLAWENHITTIEPLAGLKALKNLQLQGNTIADLSPLAGLSQLEYLSLSENTPGDLSAISSLHKLNFLALNKMAIADLGFLAGLTAMKDLYLKNNAIADITPLKDMKALELVLLDNNDIKDFSILKTLPKLKYISTKGNPGGTITRRKKTVLAH